MTARLFKSLLHRLGFAFWKRKSGGFTLIELLVSMVIASIVTSGLMYMVVQLLETSQKESVQTRTNQEMQSALDFIISELREAVYVYNGDCLKGNGDTKATTAPGYCPGIVNHIINNPDNSAPILAFWKLDELPPSLKTQCKATPSPANIPCDAGRTYTLVVYYLRKNQENDTEKWLGRARITRYELSQYDGDGKAVTGYVNPEQAGVGFQFWPYRMNPGGETLTLLQTAGKPTNNPAVLVDFVDDQTEEEVSCPDNYERTPKFPPFKSTSSPFNGVRSFYACVKNNSGFNQDTIVFLRGNHLGKADKNIDISRLPTMQTQVLNRGVVDKVPKQLK